MRNIVALGSLIAASLSTAAIADTFEATVNRAVYSVDLDTVKIERLEGMTADSLTIPYVIRQPQGNRSEHVMAALCGTTKTEFSEGKRLYVRKATIAWRSFDQDGKLTRQWQAKEFDWKVPHHQSGDFKIIEAACESKGL